MGFFHSSGILNRRGFFGAKPFSPLDISGLDLWLDASDGNSLYDATSGGSLVTTDGSAVKRWEDKSGNGNHATEATAAPLLEVAEKNGLNALNFATSKYITVSFTAKNYTKQSIFVVLNFSTSALNFGRYFSQTVSGNNDFQFSNGTIPIIRNGTSNAICIFKNGTGAVCSVNATNNTWYIARHLHTGSAMTLRLNSTTSSSDSHTLNISPNRFRLGSDISSTGGATQFTNNLISEVILYDKAVSDAESDSVTNYLNNKWAIY